MAAVHRIIVDAMQPAPGDILQIAADEARHAAHAKRLRAGDHVQLLDGRGLLAHATLEEIRRERTGPVLNLRILSAERLPPIAPRLVVIAATPKGGRVDELVDSLSQIGAAAWRPLSAARTVVDPRPTKLDRLARLAAEAAKQSGRPWMLQIGAPITLNEALAPADAPAPPGTPAPALVLADASGGPYEPTGSGEIHLLVGPEGGFEDRELAAARTAEAQIASFGPHIMRIETAALAAAAVVLAAEAAASKKGNIADPARVRMK